MHQKQNDSDWVLLYKLKQNDTNAFEVFYSKYASMMFGCILDICKDHKLASQIFKNIFLNLKSIELSTSQHPFAFWLWQYTGSATKRFIIETVTEKNTDERKEALIEFMCFNKLGREEAALYFNIDNKDIGRRVKRELQNPN